MNQSWDYFFVSVSSEQQKIERAKARELKNSPWWKNQLAKSECYHCKQRFHPKELTMDHVTPIARGGKSDKKNCVPSCKPCNTKRKYYLPEELALMKLKSQDE